MTEIDSRERTEIVSKIIGLMTLLLESDPNAVLYIEGAKRQAMEYIKTKKLKKAA